jgi:threonine efflux protein
VTLRPLVALAVLHLAATVSPGPAFVLVVRSASVSTRTVALRVAAGTVAASVVWAIAALLGIQAIMAQMSSVFRGLEIAGGVYLAVIGEQLWRCARVPVSVQSSASRSAAGFAKGLAVGLSNPKVMIFFATIFATALGPSSPSSWKVSAIGIVLVNESLWFGTVALCFASGSTRAFYLRIKPALERVFATTLIGFATTLIWRGVRGSA